MKKIKTLIKNIRYLMTHDLRKDSASKVGMYHSEDFSTWFAKMVERTK